MTTAAVAMSVLPLLCRLKGILTCQIPSWGGSLGMLGVTEGMATGEWLKS